MSFDEVAGLEVRLAAELELFRLRTERAAVHKIWSEAAHAGRASVDMEDGYESGTAQLAIQKRESDTWGKMIRYLQGVLDRIDADIRKSMAEAAPKLPGT